MSFRTLAVYAFLAFQFVVASTNPLAALPVETTKSELVKVPGGYLPKSNVHAVPEGGRIIHTSDGVQLIDAQGKIIHSAPSTSSQPVFSRLNTSGTSSNKVRRNLNSAIVAAIWQASSVSSFLSDWVVPPSPQTYVGQLLEYFIALSPPSGDSLIQPVLQYGASVAGGGAYWSVGSWFITGNTGYYTNFTRLPSGDSKEYPFIINQDEFLGTPTTHSWYCGFEFFTQASTLNIQTSEVFNVAYVALEIGNAESLSDLPGQTTNAENIAIADDSSSFPSPIPWTVANDSADGITMKVVSALNGQNAALQIFYAGEEF